jgi:hypothetical protein
VIIDNHGLILIFRENLGINSSVDLITGGIIDHETACRIAGVASAS